MPLVNLPDGTQANFPDTMANSDIEAAIAKNYPQFAPKSTGTKVVDSVDAFLDAVGNKIPFMNKVPNTWGGDENAAQTAINQNTADHPIANTAGGIVGSTLPYIAGGAVAAGAKLPLVGKALVNGGIGAAQGVADTDVDPNASAMDKITAYLKGGAVGAAGGVAGELGGAAATKAATSMAPRAVGGIKSILKTMTPEARADAGSYLLNAPDDGSQVIKPFSSSAGLVKRNEANLKNAGQTIGNTLSRVDATGNHFDTLGAAGDVNGLFSNVPGAPINKASDAAVSNSIDDLLEHAAQIGDLPNGNLSLADANELKGKYGKATDFRPSSVGDSQANDVNRKVYGILKDKVQSGITDGLLGQSDGEQAVQDYLNANSTYRNASNVGTMLDNLQTSEEGNNMLGLASKIGIASGHPEAVPAAVGLEFLNRRLPTTAAYGLDQAGKSTLGIVPQAANGAMSTINDYLNQSQPGHPNQQGSDQ